ncbi:MAG: hypothetical protein HHAS10_11740 [Candidatus Altimarinota bacterium]
MEELLNTTPNNPLSSESSGNPPPIDQTPPPQVKKSTYKMVIIGLSIVEFIFLIAIGGLYYELQKTKETNEGEILRIKAESSGSIESIKNDNEKEVLRLNQEIESLKNKLKSYEEAEDDNPLASNENRDEVRILDLNKIATTLGAYYADKEMYPPNDISGCLPQEYLNSNYFPKGVPVDPNKNHKNVGCSRPGEYEYRGYGDIEYERGNASTIKGAKFYAIGTKLDDPTLGNSAKPLSEYSEEETSSNNLYGHLVKGSGPYYIVTN